MLCYRHLVISSDMPSWTTDGVNRLAWLTVLGGGKPSMQKSCLVGSYAASRHAMHVCLATWQKASPEREGRREGRRKRGRDEPILSAPVHSGDSGINPFLRTNTHGPIVPSGYHLPPNLLSWRERHRHMGSRESSKPQPDCW